jgi:DNA invertase Pin-like site-specific DNA recombinase
MTHIQKTDGREKLSEAQRIEVSRRFFNRLETGETVTQIASDFGISLPTTRKVAREYRLKNEIAPES